MNKDKNFTKEEVDELSDIVKRRIMDQSFQSLFLN